MIRPGIGQWRATRGWRSLNEVNPMTDHRAQTSILGREPALSYFRMSG
jgi:hypothetical protein